MNVKDKVVFGILIVLLIAGGYFHYQSNELNRRMDGIIKEEQAHTFITQNEFREDLRQLNLQFIGRGKHVQQAQKDILSNTDLIQAMTDSLASLIDDVNYALNALDRDVQKRFRNVENDIADVGDDLRGHKSRSKRKLSDLEQTLSTLESRLKEIEALPIIQKDKAKQAEK
ncbi:MAG: hypothetical protein HN657_00735 [Candidatus Marinimicrobia bacterium]|jgi:methyl-accepting chemotaxis protein|nr:hypothetical protein [Candidatus Neomarinimicrobiota bacterium]MBT3496490.1 hypothetical protein [Candidatus Neomarinimicrobiota bacterium]MBT3692187.1 hypothetical protein [Candidatus Neomarinimicrobiota bacterium]MBT3732845.1 hypothetical protein [Candidatus Neomarinimicrobiota bacterium]MBT4144482.1 hypothetical protein [Candidatus Neomarinimicrobiota bacterium]